MIKDKTTIWSGHRRYRTLIKKFKVTKQLLMPAQKITGVLNGELFGLVWASKKSNWRFELNSISD